MKLKVFAKKFIIFLAFGFRAGESVLEHLTVFNNTNIIDACHNAAEVFTVKKL